jgi:hypothetical protein
MPLVVFFLYLVAVFFVIGMPFGSLLERLGLRQSFTALSCFGLTAVSIFVTIGYKTGLSVEALASIVNMTAFLFLVFATTKLLRQRTWPEIQPDWSLGISVTAAVLMFAPALAGGLRFAIFQGNHIDSYNYLECALTYQRVSYQTAINSTVQQFLDAGLFPIARDALSARPAICLVYGTLVSTFPGQGVMIHYGMLAYFQFLSFCVVSLLASELVPGKPFLTRLLSLAIVGGFWGQYIVDINAWSQAAAMPLLLLGILLLVRLFSELEQSEQRSLTPTQMLAFSLNCVGAFYLYPEGAMFYFPAFGAVFLLGIFQSRPRIALGACGVIITFCAILVLLVRENNLTFLTSQIGVALRSDVNWWRYYQAFLFGNSGIHKKLFFNLANGLAGVFGCYFMTPGRDYRGLTIFLYRIFLSTGFLFLLVWSILRFRTLARPARGVLFASVLFMISETLVFCLFRQYWAAGKALSYFAYLLLLLILAPALNVHIPRSRLAFAGIFLAGIVVVAQIYTARNQPAYITYFLLIVVLAPVLAAELFLGRLTLVGALIAGTIFVGQIGFALYRPLAASLPYGIHYLMPPYPAIQVEGLKRDIDFSDLDFLKKIQKQDHVMVEVSDPWVQVFLKLLLLSKNIDFCVSAPVLVTAEPLNIAPSTQPCASATCRLFLVPTNKNGYRQAVQVERLGDNSPGSNP